MQSKSLLSVAPLFFVLAIDSMGLGILFPILSSMLISPHSLFLAPGTTSFTRELLYGIIIGVYMICWFFGSAILGDFSDSVGRKKALLICLYGAAFGYLLSGAAILLHSVSFLIIGRIIAGFTAGSQPIAQAAIIDVSPEEHKARNIGYILLAISIGFLIGPLAGGLLSDPNFGHGFNLATPMFFATALSIFNALLLAIYFNETVTTHRVFRLRLHYAVQIFVEAFRHPKIRWLSLILLIFISGWSEYFSFVSQFLIIRFDYTTLQVSLFMVVLAMGFSAGFGFLVNYCANRFALKNCVVAGLLISALLCLLTVWVHVPWILWISSLLIGMSVSVGYSVLVTLFSNQVSASEQGWVMGVTNAIMALSFGVSTFLSGFAADFSAGAPLLWGFAGMGIAGVMMKFLKI